MSKSASNETPTAEPPDGDTDMELYDLRVTVDRIEGRPEERLVTRIDRIGRRHMTSFEQLT